MNLNNGYYIVGDRTFTKKYDALLHSLQNRQPISYRWHHSTWSNFNRSLLGKYSLKQLYAQRAKQIREKYDYVILFFSGGSDSWTVLNTFLENNIKIDCVCVRWPMKMMGKYKPNTQDKSAFNFISEWDFVIHKDLQWLAQHHPEIKIEIADWFEGADTLKPVSDDKFLQQGFWYNFGSVYQMNALPDAWLKNIEKGLSVCRVFGVDKPFIECVDGANVAMCFYDGMVVQGSPDERFGIGSGVENFYWSPDFPLLTYEQAYQYFLLFKRNPTLRHVINHQTYNLLRGDKPLKEYIDDMFDMKMHLARLALYPDWDFSKFQALKPRSPTREDKNYWLLNHPEMKYIADVWRDKNKTLMKTLHPQLLDESGNSLRMHRTPFYHIGNYND